MGEKSLPLYVIFRSSSIYTIVDKIMSTVANETLTDDRDRKYFLDSHREPGNGYKCCTWPLCLPTLFIPVVSIAQIAVQIAYVYQHATNPSNLK